mgnify:CR=1 FL=1
MPPHISLFTNGTIALLFLGLMSIGMVYFLLTGAQRDAVPADAWDVAVLDRLRELALELGAQLRRLAAAHEHEE